MPFSSEPELFDLLGEKIVEPKQPATPAPKKKQPAYADLGYREIPLRPYQVIKQGLVTFILHEDSMHLFR